MSEKTVAKLAVELVGRDAQLRQTLERSKKDGADWGQSMASAAKVGAAGIAAVATAAITAGTAVSTLALRNAELGRELRAVAAVGNTSVVEFQALTHAAREYNIEQGKTGDILKDLQDKLGDYAATGGGEMADFFENIGNAAGLTVEKLQAMSGPDALIAIKSAMEQANVPMAQQVFYLESIADEASRLMPLLAEGGAKYAQLGREYLATNSALTDSEITKFDEYAKDVELMTGSFGALLREAVIPFVDEMEEGAEYLTQLLSSGRRNLLAGQINEAHTELVALREEVAAIEGGDGKTHGAVGDGIMERLGNAILGNTHKGTYLAEKRQEIEALEGELYELQERMAQLSGKPSAPAGNSTGGVDAGILSGRLKAEQEAGAQLLAQLRQQLDSEEEVIRTAHETRLDQIAEMQLSEQELARSGHESMALLREELGMLSQEKMLEDLQAIEDRERESQERRLEQERRYWKRKQQEEAREQKKQLQAQATWDQQYLAMQMGVAEQGLGLLKSTAKEGSMIQKALIVAEAGMAMTRVFVQTQVAAMRAMAELGPIAGPPMAGAIETMGQVSMGLIAGQAIAGMAHDGHDYIPQEGTWLLDKGERVLSPRQNSDLTRFLEQGGAGAGISVVINEAPGSNEKDVRQQQGPDGRMLLIIDERVRSVVNEDVSRGTGVSRAFERTFGLTRGGR